MYKNVYKNLFVSEVMTRKKEGSHKSAVIYTTEDCPWCHKTKEFFETHAIAFTERDVGENEKAAREMVKESGQRAVPVIKIGKEIIVGFDEPAIRNALGMKKRSFLSW